MMVIKYSDIRQLINLINSAALKHFNKEIRDVYRIKF